MMVGPVLQTPTETYLLDETEGGGVTLQLESGNIVMAVSGNPYSQNPARDPLIGNIHQEPADIVIHEMMTHVSAHLEGQSGGRHSIAGENQVRRELGMPLRGVRDRDPTHRR